MPLSIPLILQGAAAGGGGNAAPTWPGGSTVGGDNIHSRTMDITWDAATDDVAVTQYRYRLNAGSWTVVAATPRTASLSGLTPATEYTIDVQAGDVADEWSASITTTETTLGLQISNTVKNPDGDTSRVNQTSVKYLVLGEAIGSTATPTVLAYSTSGSTNGSGVFSIDLSATDVNSEDNVWLVMMVSDGDPTHSGWSVAWPQMVTEF